MDLRFTVIMIFIISKISAQSSPYSLVYEDCCELKLMDSNLQVAIESNRILPTGNFSLIKARFCSIDTIFIQLWRKLNDSSFEFRWQFQYSASIVDTENRYTLLRFDNNPVAISSNDRLGVYNPSKNNLKFAIPYEFNKQESHSLIFSDQRFDDPSAFVKGLIIETDDLRWPRTLVPYLTFCSSESECLESTSNYPQQSKTTTNNPYRGYIPDYCCSSVISCDIGQTVQNNLANQNNEVQNLKNTVDVLRNTLDNLLNSQYVTGICPDGFSPGTYGVGSCYIIYRELMQMGQAVIRCRDLDSKLVSIQSEQEDNFIKDFVLNSSTLDTERFWTSGMYNTDLRNWFWVDDDRVTKMPFGSFRNWKDGQELAATSIYDVCSVYTVNKINKSAYWEKAICTDLNFFICELPKICL